MYIRPPYTEGLACSTPDVGSVWISASCHASTQPVLRRPVGKFTHQQTLAV